MKKYLIIIVAIIIVLGGICMGVLFWRDQNVTLADVEQKVKLDLSKDMKLEYLESFKEYGEDHAEVKLSIEKNVEELETRIEQAYGRNLLNTEYDYLKHKSCNLWEEVQTGEILAVYEKMISGKKAKTIIIDIFIVKDNKDGDYLYIFY